MARRAAETPEEFAVEMRNEPRKALNWTRSYPRAPDKEVALRSSIQAAEAAMRPEEVADLDAIVAELGCSRSMVVRSLLKLAANFRRDEGGAVVVGAIVAEKARVAATAAERREARLAKKQAALEAQLAEVRALRGQT